MHQLADLDGHRVRLELALPFCFADFRLVSLVGTFSLAHLALLDIELANDEQQGEVARQAGLIGRTLVARPHEIRRIFPLQPRAGRPRSPG